MKDSTATPWASHKINYVLGPLSLKPTLDKFIEEVESIFADPNCKATAQQKLLEIHQGNSPVDTIIQHFELYSPASMLGSTGLIDKFE